MLASPTRMPTVMESVSPHILALDDDADIRKVLGENWVRYLRTIWGA